MTSEHLKTDFDTICKDTIIPFFKDLGFKRQGLHFARRINDITQCFNIQRSQWNALDDRLAFTFNFGFYNVAVDSAVDDCVVHRPFPKTDQCFLSNRLGSFSHSGDHWYTLYRCTEPGKTRQQVGSDLNTHLKPLFENYTSLEQLKTFLEKHESDLGLTMSALHIIGFYMATNQTEKGKALIKDVYEQSIIPQTGKVTMMLPNGKRTEKRKTFINYHLIGQMKKLAERYDIAL